MSEEYALFLNTKAALTVMRIVAGDPSLGPPWTHVDRFPDCLPLLLDLVQLKPSLGFQMERLEHTTYLKDHPCC